jgi:epoxyqueuosine reductase
LRLLDDTAPLVRGAAVWAFEKLCEEERYAAERKSRLPLEKDPQVRSEWG